jgi:hypothetical protein
VSIHYVAEAPGSWGVDLRPSTPHAVTQALDVASHGFSTLIITPTRVDPVGHIYNVDQLHAVCTYAGLLRSQRNRLSIGGPGLWAALGNEQGFGPLVGSGLSATRTIRTWIQNLDIDPFITASTGLNNGASWTWTSARVMTRREAIESIMDAFWFPYFLDPRDRLIKDQTEEWTHFPSQVSGPYPFLTPWFDGREPGGNSPMIRATFDVTDDLDEWASAITYTDAGSTTTTAGSSSYIYAGGTSVDQTKYISDTSTTSGYGPTVAASQLDSLNGVGRSITATADDPDVLSYIVPGVFVLAYDPENGIYDFTYGNYTIRGQMMWPAILSVASMRVPISEGSGVYVAVWDPTGGGGAGADDVIDLSEWFIPEDGPTTLELGRSSFRPVRQQARRDGARRQ